MSTQATPTGFEPIVDVEAYLNKLAIHRTGAQKSEHLTSATSKSSIPKVQHSNPWSNYLCFERMMPTALIPTKESENDAGYDLYSFSNYTLPAWESVLVSTQIKAGIPPGFYGLIKSRSGLAVKHNIEVGAGVIDRSYQGEIKVLLRNFSDSPYQITSGDRIAQMIMQPYRSFPVKTVSSIVDLFGTTTRGVGGFGSSGK